VSPFRASEPGGEERQNLVSGGQCRLPRFVDQVGGHDAVRAADHVAEEGWAIGVGRVVRQHPGDESIAQRGPVGRKPCRGAEAISGEPVAEHGEVISFQPPAEGKAALFDAVLEATEARIARSVAAAAATERNPRDALRAGCLAWLRLSEDPAAQRIALIDAPAVVGWDRWREIDAKHAFGMLRAGIKAIAADAKLPAALVEPIAYMLSAALLELAIYVSRAPDVQERWRPQSTPWTSC